MNSAVWFELRWTKVSNVLDVVEHESSLERLVERLRYYELAFA